MDSPVDLAPDIRAWHMASFRRDAEPGPLPAHIGRRTAIKHDSWLRALACTLAQPKILDDQTVDARFQVGGDCIPGSFDDRIATDVE